MLPRTAERSSAQETFTWSDTDYTAQAQKIAGLNPDAVLLCDYCNQMVTFL
jgi:ABC-type branched-subunit amino acid transport system substrate-binding protein